MQGRKKKRKRCQQRDARQEKGTMCCLLSTSTVVNSGHAKLLKLLEYSALSASATYDALCTAALLADAAAASRHRLSCTISCSFAPWLPQCVQLPAGRRCYTTSASLQLLQNNTGSKTNCAVYTSDQITFGSETLYFIA